MTVHDTLSVVREDALPRIGLSVTERPGSLDLENERISSASHQEEHPARGAYAPDADYLDRGAPLTHSDQGDVRWWERQGFSVPGEGLPGRPAGPLQGVIFPVEDCWELVL